MALDDIQRSINDGEKAIQEIRGVVSELTGILDKSFLEILDGAANEIEGYLLSDAKEAIDRIDKLESELDDTQSRLSVLETAESS